MGRIYRGTSKEWVDRYVAASPMTFEPTGGGEFGAGCYFWQDDLPAAIMSALQYNGRERDWGVVEVEFEDKELGALATRAEGYGSRVLEFKHDRPSYFGRQAGAFVVPREYSHLALDPEQQDGYLPQRTTPPPLRTYGLMQSEQFRNINASPEKYGIDGIRNGVVWQYDLIVGKCAADYSDAYLVQMKFANHGMTFLNNTAMCRRRRVITGKRLTTAWTKVQAWRMQDRDKLYEQYFHAVTDLDLNARLG